MNHLSPLPFILANGREFPKDGGDTSPLSWWFPAHAKLVILSNVHTLLVFNFFSSLNDLLETAHYFFFDNLQKYFIKATKSFKAFLHCARFLNIPSDKKVFDSQGVTSLIFLEQFFFRAEYPPKYSVILPECTQNLSDSSSYHSH